MGNYTEHLGERELIEMVMIAGLYLTFRSWFAYSNCGTLFRPPLERAHAERISRTSLFGDRFDGRAVVLKMKELPTYEPLYGKDSIRLDDRKLHLGYIYQTKTVSESEGSWDYLRVIKRIDAEVAFRPLCRIRL